MWSRSDIKSGGSAHSSGGSEGLCDVTLLLQNGHISPTCLVWRKISWCFLYFLSSFCSTWRTYYFKETDHLLKQWLIFFSFLFYLEESEVAGIVAQISYLMYSQTIDSYILSSLFFFYLVGSTNFVLHHTSTGCSNICLSTRKVFRCSASWISWTNNLLC